MQKDNNNVPEECDVCNAAAMCTIRWAIRRGDHKHTVAALQEHQQCRQHVHDPLGIAAGIKHTVAAPPKHVHMKTWTTQTSRQFFGKPTKPRGPESHYVPSFPRLPNLTSLFTLMLCSIG
jgi:hypothetical protein